MKPTTFKTGRVVLAFLIIGLTIGLVSWDSKQAPGGQFRQTFNDTPKPKSTDHKKIRNLDDVLEELDRTDIDLELSKAKMDFDAAMKQLDMGQLKQQIEQAMKQVDMQKIQEEVNLSMKSFDAAKIKSDIDEAMKGIDVEKMKKDVQESLAKVDFADVKKEMALAMKSFDAAKIQDEVRKSMESINLEKMKEQMSQLKDIDIEKIKAEMKIASDQIMSIKPELEKAKVELENAKAEMREYKGFVDGLDNDVLINKHQPYTIKHENGELFINGKKVSPMVYSRYKAFLDKHKEFVIEQTNDDFKFRTDKSNLHQD